MRRSLPWSLGSPRGGLLLCGCGCCAKEGFLLGAFHCEVVSFSDALFDGLVAGLSLHGDLP